MNGVGATWEQPIMTSIPRSRLVISVTLFLVISMMILFSDC